MRFFRPVLLLLFFGSILSSCATMIEGSIDKVRYHGGPGRLAFYTDSGSQLASSYRYDDFLRRHENTIELDKKAPVHIIIARHDDLMQVDTLRREFNYLWLIPNAVPVYAFPVFAMVDILTSSIYSFPDQKVTLHSKTIAGLVDPKPILELAVEPDNDNVMLSGYIGILMPVEAQPSGLPSFGGYFGYHLGHRVWGTGGYAFGAQLLQRIGMLQRRYRTNVHSVEIGVNYQPVSFAYLIAGVGYDHMIFERTFGREGEERPRFGRNLPTTKLGLGVYFSGVFLEYRRVMSLGRIETPEGPGHAIAYNTLRFGASLRFELPQW